MPDHKKIYISKKEIVSVLLVLLLPCNYITSEPGNRINIAHPADQNTLAPYLLFKQHLKLLSSILGADIFDFVKTRSGLEMIAIGGYSGTGKTTGIVEIEKYLRARGKNVVIIRRDWFYKGSEYTASILKPYFAENRKFTDHSRFYDDAGYADLLRRVFEFKISGNENATIPLRKLYSREGIETGAPESIFLDKNTVVMIDGTKTITDDIKPYMDRSYFFNISHEKQKARILAREKKKDPAKRRPDEFLIKRVDLHERPYGDLYKAEALRNYDLLIDYKNAPEFHKIKTLVKYGVEFTYAGGSVASVNKITGQDKDETANALCVLSGMLDIEESLNTLISAVKNSSLFNTEEKTGLITTCKYIYYSENRPASLDSIRAWKKLLNKHDLLAGIDMIASDFDGVIKEKDRKKVSRLFIDLISSLLDSKVSHVTITGETYSLSNERLRPKFEWERLKAKKDNLSSFWVLMTTGAVARTISGNGPADGPHFRKIPGFYNDFTLMNTENMIAQQLRSIAIECGMKKEEILLLITREGVTLEMTRLKEKRKNRLKDKILKKALEEIPLIPGVPASLEIVASAGAVDIMPFSKGRALARAIKLRKAKKIMVFADSAGTIDLPGNDRSMLALTEKQIRQWEPEIDWEIELIKIYVGKESDADIPADCVIAPVPGTASTYSAYTAINKAKSGKRHPLSEGFDFDLETTDREFSSPTHPDKVREAEPDKIEKSFIKSTLRGSNISNHIKKEITGPVDIHTDLSLIHEDDLKANLKEWALIIRSCRDLPVNFIFHSKDPDHESSAVKSIKQLIPGMKDRVNKTRDKALKLSIRHVKHLDGIAGDEYPIAMAGENISNGHIAGRDFNAAVKIGLLQAVLIMNRDKKNIEELKAYIKPKLEKMYSSCGVEKDIMDSDLEQLISGNPEERITFAVNFALPPLCRLPLETLKTIHENNLRILEMA
jgi:uridine kinase